MQVYRDLRILTARPSPEDEARVPHTLYGFVDGGDAYSAGRYAADARRAIAEARRQGLRPIVVGGTGLYFKALIEGLSPMPEIPAEIRTHWRAEAAKAGPGMLHAALAGRDAAMAARLAPGDTQRIVRALEVLDASGTSLLDWQQRPREAVLDEADTVRLVVAPERTLLAQRIATRFAGMLAAGALEEVRQLAARRLDPALPIMGTLGLAPLIAHLEGKLSREAAIEAAEAETRQYAKRQITWARGNMLSWKWLSTKETESNEEEFVSFIDP
jgi:tRNA dimethylallyltransferase